ncbi:MAG: GDP-mannose 4,6-dehydratase, partial [Flavobacteriales bacterium]
SNLVHHLAFNYPDYLIINLDKLTYASNLNNLKEVEEKDNYVFIKGDIAVKDDVDKIFKENNITDVIHLAAETHVDRSIHSSLDFVNSNINGTVNLLEACKSHWYKNFNEHKFYHISTDEVFGSIEKGTFNENSNYDPRSPYSASKA